MVEDLGNKLCRIADYLSAISMDADGMSDMSENDLAEALIDYIEELYEELVADYADDFVEIGVSNSMLSAMVKTAMDSLSILDFANMVDYSIRHAFPYALF